MKTVVIFLATLALSAFAAKAQGGKQLDATTGRGFLAVCGDIDTDAADTSTEAAIKDLKCTYYFEGVLDGMDEVMKPGSMPTLGIYMPPGTTTLDLIKTANKLILSAPAYLDKKTNSILFESWLIYYPCH